MWSDNVEVRVRTRLRCGRLTSMGSMYSTFEWRDPETGRYHTERSVRNVDITPEPCGICKGSGRVLRAVYGLGAECTACKSKGHGPDKSKAMTNLIKTIEGTARLAGLAVLGWAAYKWVKAPVVEQAGPDIIDAEEVHPSEKRVQQCIADHVAEGRCPVCAAIHAGSCVD